MTGLRGSEWEGCCGWNEAAMEAGREKVGRRVNYALIIN
jgi:hypothetical protein